MDDRIQSDKSKPDTSQKKLRSFWDREGFLEIESVLPIHGLSKARSDLGIGHYSDKDWDQELLLLYMDVENLWSEDNPKKSEEFAEALCLVTAEEQFSLRRYHFRNDTKTHLASLLLQRFVIANLTRESWVKIHIQKTINGRPFCAGADFDYNVSHHGGRVAICVRQVDRHPVGLDLVDLKVATKNWTETSEGTKWVKDFTDIFTEVEYSQIMRSENDIEITKRRLFTFWALKEAYTKAIGVGLVTDLKSIEFSNVPDVCFPHNPHSRSAQCVVNGKPLDWRLDVIAPESDIILALATPETGLVTESTEIRKIDVEDIFKIAQPFSKPLASLQKLPL
ncbi:hypothetical protein V1511DRAFT_503515 [Dipodascopsis uninucleata]